MEITRRQFVESAVAASLLGAVREESALTAPDQSSKYRLYWGDLHNHNAVGYAKGSLERSIDLAREHLDFFAFTGHAWWHDMPKMPGDRHMKWVNGFEVHKRHWPKTRQLIREACTDEFTALLGYEWHSSEFGDYCMIFPSDQPDLFLPDHVEKLLDFAEARNALAIPHHVAYKQGWRGANFAHFRPSVSPVVEVFSEHGCSETLDAPYPFIRHSMGGRSSANTIARQLRQGLRFGFVASSDDHRGYPGAYGEGVLGVWAADLSAAGIIDAVRNRRTYAATGDRIMLEVSLNGSPMGSQLPAVADREIHVRVEGQDSVASIELLRNGRVIERYFPEDHADGPLRLPARAKCRIQYGWGPWAALDLGRVCDWEMTVRVERGSIRRATGCFQAAPFDEQRRDKMRVISDSEIHLQSNTTREKCYGEDPTKALVLDLDAAAESELIVQLKRPVEKTLRAKLTDLIEDNVVHITGVFTTESLIIQPLVGPAEFSATAHWQDRRPAITGPEWYYVRVTQHNGHVAWSSPIWVG